VHTAAAQIRQGRAWR